MERKEDEAQKDRQGRVGSSLGSSPAVASCTTLPLSFSLGLPQLVRFLMHYRLGLCGAFECGGVVRVCLDVGVVYLQVAGDTPTRRLNA